MLRLTFSFALILLNCLPAFGWGRRGHAIVAETAAALVAQDPKAEFMKHHSFDLGYYANVPDLIWKAPATYEIETPNHFMDLEIFEREMKGVAVEKPFSLDRLAFDAAFLKVPQSAGRAWWRVRELVEKLEATTKTLEKTDLTTEARHKAQGEWLLTAGALAHYVGDLAQPLHTTENYDGQLSEQKGIHSYFEDTLVNELYPALVVEVSKQAANTWKDYRKKNAAKPIFELIQELTAESNKAVAEVLKVDKKTGRKDAGKVARTYRTLLVGRLAKGSIVLAEIWSRSTGWPYDGKKFYWFDGAPAYVYPPSTTPRP